MKVSIYLPSDAFSPVTGGALATWTHHVYSRLSENVCATVVCLHCKEPYPFPEQKTFVPGRLSKLVYQRLSNRSLRGVLEPVKACLRRQPDREAARVIARLKPDLIHVHNSPEAVISLRYAMPTVPVVLHMNNDHLLTLPESVANAAIASCAAVAFCSEYVRRGASKRLHTLSTVCNWVIHNGCSVSDEIAATCGNPYRSDNTPEILFVGRIVPDKGLHLLVDAFETVKLRFPTARLKVVGGVSFGNHREDHYLREVKNAALRLGDAIQFLGPKPQTEIAGHMRSADVVVCPSVWNDPFPLVNLEAMGAGTPVVAFDRGGISEAIGDAGFVVEEIGSQALAESICKLLADHSLRAELSQKGLKRARDCFDWRIIANQWYARLREVASSPPTDKI